MKCIAFGILYYYLFSIIFYLYKGDFMSQKTVLLDKALNFAARIVKLQKYLVSEKKETIISNQIVRSGTSIGANINEAIYGQSKKDFIAKLSISLKEADSLIFDCLEIKKILIASLKTAKSNNQDAANAAK